MLWVKAFHIIAMVAWFSGLFYLPRLFVYHAESQDELSQARFTIMEKKLYFYIMTPASLATLILGIWLISFNPQGYMQMMWLHLKLGCVILLLGYHHYLGRLRRQFAAGNNQYSAKFYRIINEIPTILLCLIVILVVVKPFSLIPT
jgi:protoporphyrinogen IX oxidase